MSTIKVNTLKTLDESKSVDVADLITSDILTSSSGSSEVGYNLGLGGSIDTTVEDQLKQTISVRDFGAVGDGVEDDSLAFQAALDALAAIGGGELVVPSGTYLTSANSILLPAVPLKLRGHGTASVIISSANPIIDYPTSVTSGGKVVVQDISDLKFKVTSNNTAIGLTQTWDASGKVGPTISGCHFDLFNASSGASVAVLTGVWSGKFINNFASGNGFAGGAYGIHIITGDTTSGSVMNFTIANNIMVSIQYPIYSEDRSGSGVLEGLKVIGNNLISGGTGIRLSQSNATSITGNQISDFTKGISLNGDFDTSIVGNSEISGGTSGIELVGVSSSFTERVTISGNKVSCDDGGACVRLTNNQAVERIRKISIVGNVMNAGGSTTSKAISLEGSFYCSAITILGNSFSIFDKGIDFSVAGNIAIKYANNVYSFVTTHVNNQANADNVKTVTYTTSRNIAFSGGSATENKDISIPAGTFSSKPTFVGVISAFGYMQGYYDYDDGSTSSLNARVVVSRKDNASIGAGTYRFGIIATGPGYPDE